MTLVCDHCNDPLARHDDKGVCFVKGCVEYSCSKEGAGSPALGLTKVISSTFSMYSDGTLCTSCGHPRSIHQRMQYFCTDTEGVSDRCPCVRYERARPQSPENGLKDNDPVHHPNHYGPLHLGGPECIEITGWMTFNLGNATKYIWRAGRKTPDAIEDLRKAGVYIQFEIDRLTQEQQA